MDPLRQNFAQQVEAHYADEDTKLEQAAASERSALAAEPAGEDPGGKHRAQPIVYAPPNDLIS